MSGGSHPPDVVDRDDPTEPALRTASATRPPALSHLRNRLQSRFVLGVPWGTIALCCLIGTVYFVVQDGLGAWGEPLTIPFTSWSYRHPLGVLLGPVAHQGPDHLLANLTGTLVFGSVAEYVYGHGSTGGGLRNAPAVRAFVIFPGVALLAGVVSIAFSWGPSIGFSDVVYAFAGVALVRYPLGTVVAISVGDALSVVLRAIEEPLFVVSRTPASDPWFVDTALQSHTFGLLLGITAGVALLVVRDADPPSAFRLWVAAALFGSVQSLWVVWWPRETAYVLARGAGVLLVGCLATLITTATVAATSGLGSVSDGRARRIGFALLVVPLVVMAAVAVPINAATDVREPPEARTVDVGGYAVTYAEDVPNERLAPFAAVTGEPATTSGVLVVDPDRGIWTRPVSAGRLESDGTESIRVGGLGWDRTVFVVRRGWRTTGGNTTFQVWINPNHGGFNRVYASPPAQAAPVVAGHNVTVVPSGIRFRVRVTRANGTVGTAPIPERGENVTLGPVELRRDRDRLIAVTDDTRVPVATRQ